LRVIGDLGYQPVAERIPRQAEPVGQRDRDRLVGGGGLVRHAAGQSGSEGSGPGKGTGHGDQAAADKVYDNVDRPLVADDVAECVGFVVGLPQHVNIDTMVIKPVAQAAPHKIHRGPIDWKDAR